MLGNDCLKGKRSQSSAAQKPGLKRSVSLVKLKRALSRGELPRSGSFSNLAADVPAAQALATGLRELRAEGLLCDVVLAAGDKSFGAHQAVLAAASEQLRELFVAGGEGEVEEPALPSPPVPMRVQLRGLEEPEVVEALVDYIYQGASSASLGKDPHGLRGLSAALAMPSLESGAAPASARERAEALARQLRSLRASGCLCDFVFVAAGERMPAHQVVLAAASIPLCAFILQGLKEAAATSAASGTAPAAEGLLEAAVTPATSGAGPTAAGHKEATVTSAASSAAPIAEGHKEATVTSAASSVAPIAEGHKEATVTSAASSAAPIAEGHKEATVTSAASSAAPIAEGLGAEVASEPMELEIQGISHADALYTILNHIYGAPDVATRFRPLTEEGQWDVLRLATAFELPVLRDHAAGWLREGADASNAAIRLEVCDELGLSALRADIERQVGLARSTPQRPADILASPPSSAAVACASAPEGSKEALDWLLQQAEPSDAGSFAGTPRRRSSAKRPSVAAGESTGKATPRAGVEPADIGESLLAMASARFSDTGVPSRSPVAPVAPLACGASPSWRSDERVLKHLCEAFEQRPVWLQGPLEHRLSKQLSFDMCSRLLSQVAYQWSDGPWHTAFTRHGWDPRQHPEEAMWLQVLDFRDPAFRENGKKRISGARPEADGAATVDHNFRHPPALRTQLYQFIDIQDRIIKDLIEGSKPSAQCNRKTGWLDNVVYEASHERLVLRSRQLRERRESRNADKAAAEAKRSPKRSSAASAKAARGRLSISLRGRGRGAKTRPLKLASGTRTSGSKRPSDARRPSGARRPERGARRSGSSTGAGAKGRRSGAGGSGSQKKPPMKKARK